MSRALNDLDPQFRPLAVELIARVVEHGIAVMIVCTGRTAAEQAIAVATGHSWVEHSKHQDGLAIDLCPFETWALHGPDKLKWDTDDPVWPILGAIGQGLGLKWAVVDRQGRRKDLGHFEYVAPKPGPVAA